MKLERQSAGKISDIVSEKSSETIRQTPAMVKIESDPCSDARKSAEMLTRHTTS